MLTQDVVLKVVQGVGALVLLRWAYGLLGAFFAFFLRSPKNLKKRFGTWAIVTGATDGIGKATALELAKKGLNVVVISRTQSKLDEVRSEIINKYPVEVKTLQLDCGNLDEAACDAVRNVIKEVQDIGVLVNNVGVSYDFPEFFHDLSDAHVERLITLNINSATIMSKLVLPGMVSKKRGAIINCSSGSARLNVPLLSQYSAAKKYIEQFTKCLSAEYSSNGISVQCHTPMFVSTKLAKIRHSSFFIPSPATYAKSAVANIGYETLVSPYWPHALQIWVYESVPDFIMRTVAMKTHLSLRKRALKKMEQKKNE